MPPRTSSVEFRVRYAETDRMGVVYHANYLVWCEIGRTDHIRGTGTTYREMEEAGIGLAVAEATVRYKAPARYDDLVRVETTLTEVGSRTITFEYVVSNADTGERLATARTVLVSLDRAHRVAALPRDMRAMLARDAGLEP
ncbi:MAG TPA: thioesterase family protein [Gemmatimonadaceae bacterium]|nr:thioesterase family protein [Gemmatimonadaceae bacterium]